MSFARSARSAINRIYFEKAAHHYNEDARDFNFQTPDFTARALLDYALQDDGLPDNDPTRHNPANHNSAHGKPDDSMGDDQADKASTAAAPRSLSVYEIGIGTGLLYEAFIRHKPEHVTVQYYGCDIADNMLTEALSLLPPAHLDRADADHDTLPCGDGRMDMTASTSVFQYLENHAHALAEMARITKPGGLIAVAALSTCKFETPWGAWAYKLDMLRQKLFKLQTDYRETFVAQDALTALFEAQGLTILQNSMRYSHSHGPVHNYDCFIVARKEL